jgi:hypothetical protein
VALIIITVISLAVAVVMSLIAWRLARDERRRSEARVSALAADIRGDRPSPVRVSDSFFAGDRSLTAHRPFRALAVAALVVGSAIALVVFASGSHSSPVAAAPGTAERPIAAPLELVTLGHQRAGDRLIVRGVVRQPAGADLPGLVAVVSVLNQHGDVVASGRGLVTGDRRAKGGTESIFAVTVAGAKDASRYRVGFKSNDRSVAHLDRRERGATSSLP